MLPVWGSQTLVVKVIRKTRVMCFEFWWCFVLSIIVISNVCWQWWKKELVMRKDSVEIECCSLCERWLWWYECCSKGQRSVQKRMPWFVVRDWILDSSSSNHQQPAIKECDVVSSYLWWWTRSEKTSTQRKKLKLRKHSNDQGWKSRESDAKKAGSEWCSDNHEGREGWIRKSQEKVTNE